MPPSFGPIVVPRELNACARFRRLAAVFSGPRMATYGFADTCKNCHASREYDQRGEKERKRRYARCREKKQRAQCPS